jgi:hypothetical protein
MITLLKLSLYFQKLPLVEYTQKPKEVLPMRKLVVLLVVITILATGPGVAFAGIADAVNQLHAQGLESNAEVNQTYIDLANVSTGSVTSATYIGASQTRTDNSYTVVSQTYMEAMGKITHFVFTLSNQYHPDADLALSGVDVLPTVRVYTYGTLKDQAMYAVVSGLVDCLGNPPIRHGGGDSSSWVDNYTPAALASVTVTSFKIGDNTYTTSDGTVKTMDVAPEIVGNRTFVPVRYLANSLGVTDEDITWDGETQAVTITKDETTIGMTIGNTTLTVNGESKEMDVSPYLKDGRTMLPARWIAEPLGATVTWDETTQQTTIEVPVEQGQ